MSKIFNASSLLGFRDFTNKLNYYNANLLQQLVNLKLLIIIIGIFMVNEILSCCDLLDDIARIIII